MVTTTVLRHSQEVQGASSLFELKLPKAQDAPKIKVHKDFGRVGHGEVKSNYNLISLEKSSICRMTSRNS